jgi:tetratricopeptide (TPR) repeat protein
VIDPSLSLCYLQAVPPKSQPLEKELKQPDQFVSFWGKVGAWIAAHQKAVVLSVVLAFAAVLLAWGAQGFMRGRAERTSQAFGRIHRVATAPLIPATGEAPSADDGIPQFKTEKERLEGALKAADDFLTANGGSNLREEAQLLKARYLVGLGRAGEALPLYQSLAGSLDGRLRFLALEGQAYAQEETGAIDQAIASFQQLADQAKGQGNFLRDRALFNRARLLEKQGKTKDAEKAYRDVLTEVPTTALKEEINNRIAVLEEKVAGK